MTAHFLRTAADQNRLWSVWRRVVRGEKALVGQNLRARDICCIRGLGDPGPDWRGEANAEEREIVVRWIIENLPEPWKYL